MTWSISDWLQELRLHSLELRWFVMCSFMQWRGWFFPVSPFPVFKSLWLGRPCLSCLQGHSIPSTRTITRGDLQKVRFYPPARDDLLEAVRLYSFMQLWRKGVYLADDIECWAQPWFICLFLSRFLIQRDLHINYAREG